jgi:hypothetical protein
MRGTFWGDFLEGLTLGLVVVTYEDDDTGWNQRNVYHLPFLPPIYGFWRCAYQY